VAVAAVLLSFVGSFAAASADSDYTLGEQVVLDEFERTTANGWGTAGLGGDYTHSSPIAFSTDGASGIAAPPRPGSSVTAALPSVTALDAQASTTMTIAALPSGGNGVYAGLQLRAAAGSYYLASARVTPDGRVFVTILRVTGSTVDQVALVRDVLVASGVTAGTILHLDFAVRGTGPVDLRARAWVDGTQQPPWQAVAEDSTDVRIQSPGAVALWTYISSGSQAQPVSFGTLGAWLLVTAPEPPIAPPSDPAVPPSDPAAQPGDPAAQPTEPGAQPTEPGAPQLPAGVRGSPGAGPVGSAQYPVPATGVVVVAPSGTNSAAGTLEAPLATLEAALARAASGSTIVLRAGSYHGSFVIPTNRAITIQPYPGEAVWLDGSRVVENWVPEANVWVAANWTVRFDSSPTYSRGAPDGTTAGWQFVNSNYPMAAHPDQVWVDGVAQLQVRSRAEVVPGTFFVDTAAARLYLGSDPTGASVRAADTVKALVIAGRGSVVRGIGIHRYSPSVPDIGAVAIAANDVTIENVTITDAATTGLAVFAARATLRHVSILNCGMLGAQASTADGLTMTGLLVAGNNTEHFNRAPVSGGIKIHKSRGVEVTDSAIIGNRGNGLWFDESVYDMTITGNDVFDSIGNGIVVELSAKAVIADNVVLRSERDGILVSDSGHIGIWNNTIAENDRGINIVQGTRRASNLALPGHDQRQQLPDPTVTWITEDVTVSNNVIAAGRGKCILCVEDYSHERSAAQMQIRSNGNVLQRTSTTQPVWAIVWSRGIGNPAVYTSVWAFAQATGQDVDSLALDAVPALTGTALSPAVASLVSTVARPLDPAVALLVGQPAGTRHLGAWVEGR
jgi:hypothetical protein